MPRRELLDLEPGEEILVAARASFRGAAAVTTRATFALGSGRMRLRAYHEWQDAANASGFGPVPPDMIIAVSDRRILFGKPTFWGRMPPGFWSAIYHDDVAKIVAVQHGLVTGVAFGLTSGGVVEIEAMRGARLRRLVRIVDARHPHE